MYMQEKNSFQNKKIMIITAFFCCFLWGSAIVTIKSIYNLSGVSTVYEKMMLAGIRFVIAGFLVLIVTKLFIKSSIKIEKQNIGIIVLIGLLQTFFSYFFYYIGISNTTGANSAIICGCFNTFFVALLSPIFFKGYRFSFYNILGLIVGCFGVLVLSLSVSKNISFSFNPLGDGLLIFHSLFNSLSLLIIKTYKKNINILALNGYQFLCGGTLLLIVSIVFNPHMLNLTPLSWVLLLYSAIISATAFSLWFTLIKHHDATSVAMYQFAIPVFGTLLSIAILPNERFTATVLVALILVAASIIIYNFKRKSDVLEP